MERQYATIDLHRRRSVIVRENAAGEELGVVRMDNDPVALAMALAEAGPDPKVAVEACYGWLLGGGRVAGGWSQRPSGPPQGFALGKTGGSRTTTGTARSCWTGCSQQAA